MDIEYAADPLCNSDCNLTVILTGALDVLRALMSVKLSQMTYVLNKIYVTQRM